MRVKKGFCLVNIVCWMLAISACTSDSSSSSSTSGGKAVTVNLHIPGVPREELLSAKVADVITLDGHKEKCSRHSQTIQYHWKLNHKPSGSASSISDSSAAIPTMVVDKAGTYNVDLDVQCGNDKETRAHITITVTEARNHNNAFNAVPVAVPGQDRVVKVGDTVTLDGSRSSDADGDSLIYMWSIDARPAGSSAQLQAVSLIPNSPSLKTLNMAQEELIPDVAGKYKISLKVNDGIADSATSSLYITVTAPVSNAKPVANAGVDQSVQQGALVTLHSAGSHDADNANSQITLSYHWTVNSQPSGSAVVLSSSQAAEPSFTPQIPGQYVLRLSVSDARSTSADDFVTITVLPAVAAESLHSKLLALGLDDADANYLETNHKADAEAVVAIPTNSLFFDGVVPVDAMFKPSDNPDGASFTSVYQLSNWQSRHITRFKKIFGRINFVVNSPKFKSAFDAQKSLLESQYQGVSPALPFPNSFDAFKTASIGAITADNKNFKFFLSETTSGTAYGMGGLKLGVERMGMMGDASPDGKTQPWDVNGAAALILHELTHSLGYAHDPNGPETALKPNNIPYFVQIIAGYTADNIAGTYCSNQGCFPPNIVYGTPNALLTVYFGAN